MSVMRGFGRVGIVLKYNVLISSNLKVGGVVASGLTRRGAHLCVESSLVFLTHVTPHTFHDELSHSYTSIRDVLISHLGTRDSAISS